MTISIESISPWRLEGNKVTADAGLRFKFEGVTYNTEAEVLAVLRAKPCRWAADTSYVGWKRHTGGSWGNHDPALFPAMVDDAYCIYLYCARQPGIKVTKNTGDLCDAAKLFGILPSASKDNAPTYWNYDTTELTSKVHIFGVWTYEDAPWDPIPCLSWSNNCINYPSRWPYGSYPVMLELQAHEVQVWRVADCPSSVVAVGDFKQLQAFVINPTLQVFTKYPLGPIIHSGSVQDTQEFWDAAALAAGVTGTYPTNYPVTVTSSCWSEPYATPIVIDPAAVPEGCFASINQTCNINAALTESDSPATLSAQSCEVQSHLVPAHCNIPSN